MNVLRYDTPTWTADGSLSITPPARWRACASGSPQRLANRILYKRPRRRAAAIWDICVRPMTATASPTNTSGAAYDGNAHRRRQLVTAWRFDQGTLLGPAGAEYLATRWTRKADRFGMVYAMQPGANAVARRVCGHDGEWLRGRVNSTVPGYAASTDATGARFISMIGQWVYNQCPSAAAWSTPSLTACAPTYNAANDRVITLSGPPAT